MKTDFELKNIDVLIRKALQKYEEGINEIKSSIQPIDYYMSLKALATYSGISKRKLKDLIKHTEYPLPTFKIDGSIRIKKSEFESWINQFRLVPENRGKVVDEIVDDIIKDLRKSA